MNHSIRVKDRDVIDNTISYPCVCRHKASSSSDSQPAIQTRDNHQGVLDKLIKEGAFDTYLEKNKYFFFRSMYETEADVEATEETVTDLLDNHFGSKQNKPLNYECKYVKLFEEVFNGTLFNFNYLGDMCPSHINFEVKRI